MHALVAIIATPRHIAHTYFYQLNIVLNGRLQVNYLLVCWAIFTYIARIRLKYLSKDILASSLKLILLIIQ